MIKTNKPIASYRSKTGSYLVEAPGIMLILFVFLTFPLMDMAAVGLRSYFLITSAREAAHHASKSLTYSTAAPLPAGTLANNVPAMTVASDTVRNYLRPFSGVEASNIKVGILIVDNATGSRSGPFFEPLSQDQINLAKNQYYLDVQVQGNVKPLISYEGGLLGSIPGLTAPYNLFAHGEDVFENPKGLTL